MPYQSFEAGLREGDSDSFGKLSALHLPALSGKSFLDVGCNEGFFCGWAHFSGASRVAGLDISDHAIGSARKRFPEVEFTCGSWSSLPEGPFDVVLMASALHYAEEPERLLERLVGLLTPTGVLVLETGVDAEALGPGFSEIARPVGDRVKHPKRDAIRLICREHGWLYRRVGPSVRQAGDPLPRVVFHIAKPVSTAWLLLGDSTSGKSFQSQRLSQIPGTQVVSGDADLHQLVTIERNQVTVPLLEAAQTGAEAANWQASYEEILARGLEAEFVDYMLRKVPSETDAIIDCAWPRWGRQRFKACVSSHGFLPLELNWEHPLLARASNVDGRMLERYGAWVSSGVENDSVGRTPDVQLSSDITHLLDERSRLLAERDRLRELLRELQHGPS